MHSKILLVLARARLACSLVLAAALGLAFGVAGATVQATDALAGTSAVANRGSSGVTADGLPTVQINGVVWTQLVVGNTVYAAGKFSTARPAGAVPGQHAVKRSNLLAFDIRTGKLITSFAPATNGAVRALAISPDKKTLYVGGEFTKVNGAKRLRFAAVSSGTGALRSIAPSFNKPVRAIATVGSTVYVGGFFDHVGSSVRHRLAAVNATSGKLRAWKPASDGYVYAMTFTPGRRSLVVGGNFSKIGRTKACGMSRLGLRKGEVQSWSINTIVRNCGRGTAILSLKSDATRVYGSGFNFRGQGNYEGVFASSGSGELVWLQDCRGDTYDVAIAAGRVYSVGHAHNCGNIGAFPDTKPRTYYPALAATSGATGSVGRSPGGFTAFKGKPSPSLINWFPALSPGKVSGMQQAAWSVVAAGPYVVLGGEFTAVNGVAQQGLVRMALPTLAPKKEGPHGFGSSAKPVLKQQADGSVTVTTRTAWDRDDQALTYTLIRNDVQIARRTVTSRSWDRQPVSFREISLLPATTYTWRVEVSDPDGNRTRSNGTSLTTPALESPAPEPSPTGSEPPAAPDDQAPVAPPAGG